MAQRRKKQYLKNLYPNCKYTQGRLADELGVSQSYIARVLNGEKTPSLRLAIRMAKLLDVPATEFNPAAKQMAKVLGIPVDMLGQVGENANANRN